jgi:hypothetical protein
MEFNIEEDYKKASITLSIKVESEKIILEEENKISNKRISKLKQDIKFYNELTIQEKENKKKEENRRIEKEKRENKNKIIESKRKLKDKTNEKKQNNEIEFGY